MFDDVVLVTPRHRPITPKGVAQKKYIEAIRTHDLTFGIGPAGTGQDVPGHGHGGERRCSTRAYKRIVLARPAVEAGEKLGFLPGDLAEKVNPYLRPLYDALHDMMDIERAEGLISRGQIEVAPLAFMRGRTLNDSFVILDEAQNATSEQMRMFLTRLGYASKAVVTGDVTQVDLPQRHQERPRRDAKNLLSGIEGIAFCTFTDVDVVRHPLVQKIVVAYEQRDKKIADSRAKPRTVSVDSTGRGRAPEAPCGRRPWPARSAVRVASRTLVSDPRQAATRGQPSRIRSLSRAARCTGRRDHAGRGVGSGARSAAPVRATLRRRARDAHLARAPARR